MNNGQKIFSGQSAREMTAEIDRATDMMTEAAESAASNSEMAVGGQVAGREQAQRLGVRALENGLEQLTSDQELSRDAAELTQSEDFVGEESGLQVSERLAEDQEDLQSEEGTGIGFVDKIVAKTQERVAETMVPTVEALVRQKNYRPAELMSLYRQGVNQTLRVFNRKIGDRN